MLSSLPPELLVQIFKSLPSFDAILALRDADETFARILELNTRTILTAQVDNIRNRDDYVFGNNALGAYNTLLNPRKNKSSSHWMSLGGTRWF